MNTVKTMLGLCAVLTLGLMPLQAVAQSGSPARERGEVVICRGVEAHTCGPMVKVGQEAPDFRAVKCSCFETGKYCRALPVDGSALCAVPFLYN